MFLINLIRNISIIFSYLFTICKFRISTIVAKYFARVLKVKTKVRVIKSEYSKTKNVNRRSEAYC